MLQGEVVLELRSQGSSTFLWAMRPERILLPLDVERCPLEAFEVVNGFARESPMTVILLHVVELNIAAPGGRVYEELGKEAEFYLERLAEKHMDRMATTMVHVRTGRPADEILAEADAERVDCIILPTFGPSFWRRVTGIWKADRNPVLSTLVQRLVSRARCGVFLVQVRASFDCEMAWGRPKEEREAEKAVSSHQ